jgi:hypothetical protein
MFVSAVFQQPWIRQSSRGKWLRDLLGEERTRLVYAIAGWGTMTRGLVLLLEEMADVPHLTTLFLCIVIGGAVVRYGWRS